MATFYCSSGFFPTENTPNIKVAKWNLLGMKTPMHIWNATFHCNVSNCPPCGAKTVAVIVLVIWAKSHFEICHFAITPTGGAAKNFYKCTTTSHPLFKHVKSFAQAVNFVRVSTVFRFWAPIVHISPFMMFLQRERYWEYINRCTTTMTKLKYDVRLLFITWC